MNYIPKDIFYNRDYQKHGASLDRSSLSSACLKELLNFSEEGYLFQLLYLGLLRFKALTSYVISLSSLKWQMI